MTLGLVGRKVGMTRLFTDDGDAVPVTVVDVSNNRVTQIKAPATDGYSAVQVTFGRRRPSRVTKPAAGHFAKAGAEAGSVLREFHITEEQASGLKAGATIGGYLQGRTESGCHRHHSREGLFRRNQTPPLLLQPRYAWQLGVAQQARLYWSEPGSEQGVSRQTHGGTSG